MNVSADQVRAATRSAAAVIKPENVPPLWLGEAPGSHQRARRLWMAWAAPVAAVAAVAITAAGSVAAGSWFARSGSGPSSVRGAVKHRAGDYTGAGTPGVLRGDRKPVIRGRKGHRYRGHARQDPHACPLRRCYRGRRRPDIRPRRAAPGNGAYGAVAGTAAFYLLRLSASGAEESLTQFAIPALPEGTRVTGPALSPDGSKLAVEVGSGAAGQPGRQQIIIDLHRVAGVEEPVGQERRIGDLLGVRVQAPRLAQRGHFRVFCGSSRGHAASQPM